MPPGCRPDRGVAGNRDHSANHRPDARSTGDRDGTIRGGGAIVRLVGDQLVVAGGTVDPIHAAAFTNPCT
jgi:hypothetical protein